MAGFSSSVASSGGGGQTAPYDPQSYLGGQSQDSQQSAGQSPAPPGPSPDFVQQIGQLGMQIEKQGSQIEQTLEALSGQSPEAADDFRAAKQALRTMNQAVKKGMAKILTTNPQASGGPMAPKTV